MNKITVPRKYEKTLNQLIMFMYKGGKITHEDWCEDEWITIKNGEFITESGGNFIVSPWMIRDDRFSIYEELTHE